MKKKAVKKSAPTIRIPLSPAVARLVRLATPILGRSYLEFVPHADERLSERRISDNDIIQVLQTPSVTNLRADPPYKRVSKHFSARRTVSVVFCLMQPNKIVIITAYEQ